MNEIAYLGWLGEMNFGDDLIYRAWQGALGERITTTLPLDRRSYARRLPSTMKTAVRLRRRETVVLLGGGTTLGFARWAEHIELAMRIQRPRRMIVAGAGAAASQDGYLIGLQQLDWSMWRSMHDILLWGVRGPITQQEVSGNWRPVPVIGDPALLIPELREVDRSGRIGVCIGSQEGTRFDVAGVADALVAGDLALGGPGIKLFQLAKSDAGVTAELADRVGRSTEIVRYDGDVMDILDEIASCRIFISERLHGSVAAVGQGVPTIALSYASKCDDFWMSVTDMRPRIGPDQSSAALLEEIIRVDGQGDDVIRGRVSELRSQLQSAAGLLSGWLDGNVGLDQLDLGLQNGMR